MGALKMRNHQEHAKTKSGNSDLKDTTHKQPRGDPGAKVPFPIPGGGGELPRKKVINLFSQPRKMKIHTLTHNPQLRINTQETLGPRPPGKVCYSHNFAPHCRCKFFFISACETYSSDLDQTLDPPRHSLHPPTSVETVERKFCTHESYAMGSG